MKPRLRAGLVCLACIATGSPWGAEAGAFPLAITALLAGEGSAAHGNTTAAGSAYAAVADRLLPTVARRINEGPDPASPARIPVGEEAVLGETWKRSLDPAAFERQVQTFFGLAG